MQMTLFFAVVGTMIALYNRDAKKGGDGQEIDVSLYESSSCFFLFHL